MINQLLKLRGNTSGKFFTIIELIGIGLLIGIWSLISYFELIPASLFPPPWRVIGAFKELHVDDALVRNTIFSIRLNFIGYLEAVLIALPLGFII